MVRRKKNLEKVVRRKNLEKVVASIPVEEVLEEPVEVVIEKKRDLAKADRTQFLDRAQVRESQGVWLFSCRVQAVNREKEGRGALKGGLFCWLCPMFSSSFSLSHTEVCVPVWSCVDGKGCYCAPQV